MVRRLIQLSWIVNVICIICRGDPRWETDDSVIYFNQFDPNDLDRENYTVSLYTQHYPYGPETQEEFDPNLGRHEAFLLVGPYIFAQKADDNGDAYLLVSYNRQSFNVAQIPTPYNQQKYIVSHIEARQALVIVQHDGEFHNLYLSDETGIFFSLSLQDIVITQRAIDLQKASHLSYNKCKNHCIK